MLPGVTGLAWVTEPARAELGLGSRFRGSHRCHMPPPQALEVGVHPQECHMDPEATLRGTGWDLR